MYQLKFNNSKSMPRERLKKEGTSALSDQELLAIFLRTGNQKESVLALAERVLKTIDYQLFQLNTLSLQELQSIYGIGEVKAVELKAIIELGKRIAMSGVERSVSVKGSQEIAQKMMLKIGNQLQEHLIAIYLDHQNNIIIEKTIFVGTFTEAVAEPREILYYAIKNRAVSVIIVHNHPSGRVDPSQADDSFTAKIKQSCEQLNIILLDHIIVSRTQYYSFREEKKIT